jgi:hypothetical protein
MPGLDNTKKKAYNHSNLVTITCPPPTPPFSSGGNNHTGPTGPTGHIGYRGHTGTRGKTGPIGEHGLGLFKLVSLDPESISIPQSNTIVKIKNEGRASHVNTLEFFNSCILTFNTLYRFC